jgi:hypothetical protein
VDLVSRQPSPTASADLHVRRLNERVQNARDTARMSHHKENGLKNPHEYSKLLKPTRLQNQIAEKILDIDIEYQTFDCPKTKTIMHGYRSEPQNVFLQEDNANFAVHI